METLFTPWRYSYISRNPAPSDCFFCAAAADPDDPESLVVLATAHHILLLNRHPYTNGHLMLAPRLHLADPAAAPAAARSELWELVLRCRRLLERLYRPDGFNLGMNLERAGGAGVPEHFHFHIVPRWHGDTSFMSVVGGVRLVPEDLASQWRKLRAALAAEDEA